MAVRFAATMNAVNKGLENLAPAKGADMIEDWEAAVAELDLPGSKGIARDLAALRKQPEREDRADPERIEVLLHRLGEATARIAEKADRQGDKVRELGNALSEAGVPQGDEAEDSEAKAAPRR